MYPGKYELLLGEYDLVIVVPVTREALKLVLRESGSRVRVACLDELKEAIREAVASLESVHEEH